MSKAVEAIILEAMARGEFDDLPGKGRPVDLSAYFDTPEDMRLVFSILKNAGVLPEEAEQLKEIAALKKELDACADAPKRKKLRKAIDDSLLKYNVMMERRKA